ncbi:MAG: hypothetical protein M3P18_23695 [Actinomycetota bacterium]|nr:hypothetical protein [Actinomycetota bacterium]
MPRGLEELDQSVLAAGDLPAELRRVEREVGGFELPLGSIGDVLGLEDPPVGVRARSNVLETRAPRRVLDTSLIWGEKEFTHRRRCP